MRRTIMARFNIINKAEALVEYIYTITEKSPKKIRTDLVSKLRNLSIDIIEKLVRTNAISINDPLQPDEALRRLRQQRDLIIDIQVLETMLEIAKKRGYITNHQFEYSTKITFEFREMLSRWNESDSLRIQ